VAQELEKKRAIFQMLYANEEDVPTPFDKQNISLPRSNSSLERDLGLVQNIIAQLDALMGELPKTLGSSKGITLYTPEEEDHILASWGQFLNYRAILLRIMARYSRYSEIHSQTLRRQSILLSFGAGIILYQASAQVVLMTRNSPMASRKLNEGSPDWDLPENVLNHLRRHITLDSTREALERGYSDYLKTFTATNETREAWLHERIRDAYAFFHSSGLELWGTRFRIVTETVKGFFYQPYYDIRAVVATWIGDFRYRHPEPLVSPEQIDTLMTQLQPGDILLERKNFYLSNLLLPGFWPHSLMYVGTLDELREMGLLKHSSIQMHFQVLQTLEASDSPGVFLEAVAKGVTLTSRRERLKVDYISVLRPKLSLQAKKEAILQAFRHLGKPYDFEFDFFSADKLVCSELIYRSYAGHLVFPLTRILGRYTAPPVNLVKRFRETYGTPEQQLEFILFLDGNPKTAKASFQDVDAFKKTTNRSGPLAPLRPSSLQEQSKIALEPWPY
jgi:hypothetical protein